MADVFLDTLKVYRAQSEKLFRATKKGVAGYVSRKVMDPNNWEIFENEGIDPKDMKRIGRDFDLCGKMAHEYWYRAAEAMDALMFGGELARKIVVRYSRQRGFYFLSYAQELGELFLEAQAEVGDDPIVLSSSLMASEGLYAANAVIGEGPPMSRQGFGKEAMKHFMFLNWTNELCQGHFLGTAYGG